MGSSAPAAHARILRIVPSPDVRPTASRHIATNGNSIRRAEYSPVVRRVQRKERRDGRRMIRESRSDERVQGGPPPPVHWLSQPVPYGFASITGSASVQSRPVVLGDTRWLQKKYELMQTPPVLGAVSGKSPNVPPTPKWKMQSM